jgi:hypothetical protein
MLTDAKNVDVLANPKCVMLNVLMVLNLMSLVAPLANAFINLHAILDFVIHTVSLDMNMILMVAKPAHAESLLNVLLLLVLLQTVHTVEKPNMVVIPAIVKHAHL